mmetsp:Transcript_8857/g.27505  ORF Transcript_8857/g.27505 Transcript_8857/m.27505 type:complete len:217 (+) Transcript_8857:685-1335(+)
MISFTSRLPELGRGRGAQLCGFVDRAKGSERKVHWVGGAMRTTNHVPVARVRHVEEKRRSFGKLDLATLHRLYRNGCRCLPGRHPRRHQHFCDTHVGQRGTQRLRLRSARLGEARVQRTQKHPACVAAAALTERRGGVLAEHYTPECLPARAAGDAGYGRRRRLVEPVHAHAAAAAAHKVHHRHAAVALQQPPEVALVELERVRHERLDDSVVRHH